MEEKIVSTRVDQHLHQKMKMHDEINWSAVIRNALITKLKEEEQEDWINKERLIEAAKKMDGLVRKNVSGGGKSSTQIIREWRDKRK